MRKLDARKIPLGIKLVSLAYLTALLCLVWTGLYIHYPFAFAQRGMSSMRFLHIHMAYLILVFWAIFLYWSAVTRKWIVGPIGTLFWTIMLVLQALTGFALYLPYGALSGLIASLGGLMAVRVIHYIIMYVFIAGTVFQLYLIIVRAAGGIYAKQAALRPKA